MVAESAWLLEMEEAAIRQPAKPNPALPQTKAGTLLARAMAGTCNFRGLLEGCGMTYHCHLPAPDENDEAVIEAKLELWHSPSAAVAQTGCLLPEGDVLPVNMWLIWLDRQLASQHGFHHRGQAYDRLAEIASEQQIGIDITLAEAEQDSLAHLASVAGDGTLPLTYTTGC